jgi:hypothetical protein
MFNLALATGFSSDAWTMEILGDRLRAALLVQCRARLAARARLKGALTGNGT